MTLLKESEAYIEQAGRFSVEEGRYGSDTWLESYFSYDLERRSISNMWHQARERAGLSEDDGEDQRMLWQRFTEVGGKWQEGQLGLFLNEFGVGSMPIQPSYWFRVGRGENRELDVVPLNLDLLGDVSESFIQFNDKVGEGLTEVYEKLESSEPGTGVMQVSGWELYSQFRSITDVLIFYRVDSSEIAGSIGEGKYILLNQQLSSEERAFIFNYFQLEAGVTEDVPTHGLIDGNDGFVESSAVNLITNPVKVSYEDGENHIEREVERLNEAFEEKYKRKLINDSDLTLSRSLLELAKVYSDELFSILVDFDRDRRSEYYALVRKLLLASQGMWAERNRIGVDPWRHVEEVVWGLFPMVFAHPTNNEDLRMYGDPMREMWFGNFDCSDSSRYCLVHAKYYGGKGCPDCG